jgi:hypothetical protein
MASLLCVLQPDVTGRFYYISLLVALCEWRFNQLNLGSAPKEKLPEPVQATEDVHEDFLHLF